MAATMSTQEQQLCQFLRGLSDHHSHRYTEQASKELLGSLFWCMAGGKQMYMDLLFPTTGGPSRGGTLKLREAQGAVDGAEYTEGARGNPCGHIFRAGEATYSCKTCGTDDTCCLCSRCFDATDHRGHMVRVSVSPGNSGCCDCGDHEAWKTPMYCTIHSRLEDNPNACADDAADADASSGKGKGKTAAAGTPPDLEASIRMTIGRVFDFMCDVISCSPEQLRNPKTEESILKDEKLSRLSEVYGGGDDGPPGEYTVLLWNDEKHTVNDVQDQVARACRVTLREGRMRAYQTDEIGRTVLKYSGSVTELLKVAKILEEIKITVTVRSARETFREQMCSTIIEWLCDVSGCSVGKDADILRRVICEELLRPWNQGSPAPNAIVGKGGITDEAKIAEEADFRNYRSGHDFQLFREEMQERILAGEGDDLDEDDEDDEDDDGEDGMEIFISTVTGDEDDDDMMDGEMDAANESENERDEDNEVDRNERTAARLAALDALRAGLVMDMDDVDMVDMQQRLDRQINDQGTAAGGEEQMAANADAGAPAQTTDTAMAMDEEVDWQRGLGQLEENEATMAGYPAPPLPPAGQQASESSETVVIVPDADTASATLTGTAPSSAAETVARRSIRGRDGTPSDSDTAEPMVFRLNKTGLDIPKTPSDSKSAKKDGTPQPGHYWLDVPHAYEETKPASPAEDLFQRVRLDWLILFDLRLWKKVRNDLRSLYISTVINIPEFKRVLGLRFAGLYTSLAQLYLIGDREPDHSIINISLQMLTAASITTEIVERGNFLTTLMAILYTFLTTRQVGHPWQVLDTATLTFDSGSVTNRRMYHFFVDLKYLFQSPHVQECLRTEDRYMMQFLDLVKLHQGICPNTRAVGEHIEYETDTWISASLITREINRLCRQFSDAFRNLPEADFEHLARAIRYTAKTTIISSIGAERLRFTQAENQSEVCFHRACNYEFNEHFVDYYVVEFTVEKQQISFHHALHYTLSWLIECGKSLSVEQLRSLLRFETADLRAPPRSMGRKIFRKPKRYDFSPEDYLMAAFDYPIRVCAWLAQMKANMWVRNGISLRHQAGTYRGVSQRDVAHHRDIFLIQTALVVCDPGRVLAQMIDRFGMQPWVIGIFEQKREAQDDLQHLDVVEDLIHLLVVLISDRMSLIDFGGDETAAQTMCLRRDIAHVLCFKPLSYTDICNRLPDRYQENENFQTVLEEMTTYKAPEGNADIGTFELEPRFIETVDPYSGHYNKNQREESEAAYRKWMAKKTGQPDDSIVYEPKLQPITSGIFKGLADFVHTGVFAQLIYYSLLYTLESHKLTPTVKSSRIETFAQVLLHLVLIAISEDDSTPESPETQSNDATSFIRLALCRDAMHCYIESIKCKTIVSLLIVMSDKDEFRACHPKVNLILKRMRQKRPAEFEAAYAKLDIPIDHITTGSPAYNDNSANEEREKKKKAALDRQARVMAQFQEQQKSFLANQGDIDWGISSDDEEDEFGDGNLDTDMDHDSKAAERPKKIWKYPGGTCILCQEETDDRRLYGTFALFTESLILRQTDLQDSDFVREAASTPKNLDRSAESIRPFGVAHENRQKVEKIGADGERYETERQVIGKGFPAKNCKPGTLSVGCGHIMHHHCFEAYFEATLRRHQQQIARHHPEDTSRLEFVCPLCKALGNAFLPIVWKGKEESYPGALVPAEPFQQFLEIQMTNQAHYVLGASRPVDSVQQTYRHYVDSTMVNSIVDKASQLVVEAWESISQHSSLMPQSSSTSGALGAIPWMSPAMVAAGGAAAAVGGGAAGAAASGSGSGMATVTVGNGLPEPNMVRDLVVAYNRLKKTLRRNKLPSHHTYDSREAKMVNELFASDTLVQTVGYSISAVEIQQRGTDAEYGMTLLTKITEQNLTHLRILCETVTSYLATGVQRAGGDNRIERESRLDTERQHCQLFIAQYMGEETERTRQPIAEYAPLLSHDPFIFLCECVFGLVPSHKIELAHVLRMCYLAEIVKVVYYMARNTNPQAWIGQLMNRDQGFGSTSNPGLDSFAKFCLAVSQMDLNVRAASGSNDASGLSGIIDASLLAQNANGENRAFDLGGVDTLEGYYNFVQKYALVFLRKSVVLMYAAAGVDFNSHVSPAPELTELDRLTEVLKVPSFDEMCNSLAVVNDEQHQLQRQLSASASVVGVTWSSPSVRQLVTGWVQHVYLVAANSSTASGATTAATGSSAVPPTTGSQSLQPRPSPPNPSALLSHPGIYELVGLPENFEQLLAECTRVHCLTTGKDVSEPNMCLMCGEVFCSQATCCALEERIPSRRGDIVRKIGGAQQHMRRCQGNIGLFLNIRKCCIFYLHRLSGSFGYAPYIDKYGEVDMGFRHGRPLLLNQRRYDSMLRAVWLGHGIPSFISRRLEMDINNGGWETI